MKFSFFIFHVFSVALCYTLALPAQGGDGKLLILPMTSPDETMPLPEEVIAPIPTRLPQIYTFNESGDTEILSRIQIKIYQPVQNVLALWNGKTDEDGEEILVMFAQSRSSAGSGAVLSILPLPGKPLTITRSNSCVIRDFKALLTQKWETGVQVGPDSFSSPARDDPDLHSKPFYFAWKMEDFDRLKTCLSHQISMCYQGQATIVFNSDEEKILKDYFNRGFRYFVFEIKEYNSEDFTNSEATIYRFLSTNLYFPLCIGGIGNQGRTLVDIIALTPTTLSFPESGLSLRTSENREGEVTLNGKGTVFFDQNEVERIDMNMASFTREWSQILARNFLISGQIDQFKYDFVMVNHTDDVQIPNTTPSSQQTDPLED